MALKKITSIIMMLICSSFFPMKIHSIGLNYLHLGYGPSFNGNGDLFGSTIGMEAYFKVKKCKRFSISVGANGNTHSRYSDLTYIDPYSNALVYSGLNLISSNNSLASSVSYKLLDKAVKIGIESGFSINRFTTNVPRQYAYNFPISTGFPVPVIAIAYDGKPKSYFSPAVHLNLNMAFKISETISLGIKPRLMLDNKGNIISSSAIYLGYNLSRKL